jgi:NAD-dependent SIR2 family protein deacetylase
MSKTIFILGAGASKEAGAPLMIDFLDVAHDIWKLGSVGADSKSFETVFRGISALQQVHSKSQLDIQNLESIFASFEMAQILGRLGNFSKGDIPNLLPSLRRLIVKTLEHKLTFPINNKVIKPPYPYSRFISLISYLKKQVQPQHSIAIITFNYDLALDYAFYFHSMEINYALGDGEETNTIPLLKLHGSMNWGYCPVCKEIVPWRLKEFFIKYPPIIYPNETYQRLEIGSRISGNIHECKNPMDSEPVLVPPTWNKSEYHQKLTSVWARAAKELSEAENIIVIGYSLPPTDQFFNYLYALGSTGETLLKRFLVFNPDNSGTIERRFKELLGPGAEQRYEYISETFDNAMHESLYRLVSYSEYQQANQLLSEE